jgi:hypothetical protein
MIRMKGTFAAGVMTVAGLLALASPAAFAASALTSNTSTVALSATLPESLSISTNNSAVNFNLIAGQTVQGDKSVTVTTNWILNNTRQNVRLTGWFSSATAALTDGETTPTNIPSSEVLGQVGTGTFTAFTQGPDTGGVGQAGASLNLFTQAVGASNYNSSKQVTLNLEINLSSQTQLPAGTYTGTLNLQADAL